MTSPEETNSKTEAILALICDIFREYKFHPSECVNRDANPPGILSKKIEMLKLNQIEYINDYHAYCKTCQHHMYSSSKANDINSFFQAHINSKEHLRNKTIAPFDSNNPVFAWEKWLYSGSCEICKRSDIEAFIIDTSLDTVKIVEMHCKGSRHVENLKDEYKRCMEYLSSETGFLASLCIRQFRDKKDVCLCKSCDAIIKCKKPILHSHLASDDHKQKFLMFIYKNFNIELGEKEGISQMPLLIRRVFQNGIEIPWPDGILNRELDKRCEPTPKRVNGEHESEVIFEGVTASHAGFSPKRIELILSMNDADFCNGSMCTLCEERHEDMDRHMLSNNHKMRAIIFERCNSISEVDCHYRVNRLIRLKEHKIEIEKYERLKKLLEKEGLGFGIPFEPKCAECILQNDESGKEMEDFGPESHARSTLATEAEENVPNGDPPSVPCNTESQKCNPSDDVSSIQINNINVRKLIKKFVKRDEKNVHLRHTDYCGYCRRRINPTEMEEHRRGENHKKAKMDYFRLRKRMQDDRFVNLIRSFRFFSRERLLCIGCYSILADAKCIYNHLRGERHAVNYGRLIDTDYERQTTLKYTANANDGKIVCNSCSIVIGSYEADCPSITKVVNFMKKHSSCLGRVISIGEKRDFEAAPTPTALGGNNLSNGEKEESPHVPGIGRADSNLRKVDRGKDEGKVNISKNNEIPPRNNSDAETPDKKEHEEGCRQMAKKESVPVPPKEKASNLQNMKTALKDLSKILKEKNLRSDKFLCQICLVHGVIDGVFKHVESEFHVKNEHLIGGLGKIKVLFCEACNTELLGYEEMIRQHFTLLEHKGKGAAQIWRALDTPHKCGGISLIVRGLPPSEEKKKILQMLFSCFGKVSSIKTKRAYSEIRFTDPKAFEQLAALKFLPFGKYLLKLQLKKLKPKRENAVTLRNDTITALGNLTNFDDYLSCLMSLSIHELNYAKEKEKEMYLINELKKCISTIYPNCKCHIFGSRLTELTTSDSDIDVYVDCDDTYWGENLQNPNDQARIVNRVAQILRGSDRFVKVQAVARCRVPLITCVHSETGLSCDISFKNGLGCENSRLVHYMVSLDNRIKAVILFMKNWIKINSLYRRPFFSSYALTMLIFYYLQQEPDPILPTIEYLKERYKGEGKHIAGWDCGFSTAKEDIVETNNKKTEAELILGFFKFCSEFDFESYVVSPLFGKPLKRDAFFRSVDNVASEELKEQLLQIQASMFSSKSDPICIMDPFDLSHNLTKCFPKVSFKIFIYFCRISAGLLSNSLQSKNFPYI